MKLELFKSLIAISLATTLFANTNKSSIVEPEEVLLNNQSSFNMKYDITKTGNEEEFIEALKIKDNIMYSMPTTYFLLNKIFKKFDPNEKDLTVYYTAKNIEKISSSLLWGIAINYHRLNQNSTLDVYLDKCSNDLTIACAKTITIGEMKNRLLSLTGVNEFHEKVNSTYFKPIPIDISIIIKDAYGNLVDFNHAIFDLPDNEKYSNFYNESNIKDKEYYTEIINHFLPSKHFSKDGISIRTANKISNKYTLTYKKKDLDFNVNFSINPITRGVNFNKEVLSSNKNYKIDLDIYSIYTK